MPPRHDVEAKIYERLYGPPSEHADESTHVLGGNDPAVSRPEEAPPTEPPGGRLRAIADFARARAQTWLATGALSPEGARRRGSVVAPAPSMLRAMALVALGIALVAVAALGAFVPDRAADGPPAGGPSRERAAAGPPPAAERDDAAGPRRERARARRARRAHAARRARARAASRRDGDRGRAARASAVAARPAPSEQLACSSGGGCVVLEAAPPPSASSGEVVVTGPGNAVVTRSTPAGAAAGAAGAGSLSSGDSSAGGVAVPSSP